MTVLSAILAGVGLAVLVIVPVEVRRWRNRYGPRPSRHCTNASRPLVIPKGKRYQDTTEKEDPDEP